LIGHLLLALAALLLALPTATAQPAPGTRVALVVGVSDYQYVPRLPNPANDAREVARRLERFGFQVERLSGPRVSKGEFDDALLRLRQRAAQADVVVVYFAGHGIELGGQNYLLPSDARLLDERDVRREAVALLERGGSWASPSEDLRSVARLANAPGSRHDAAGFRLARTVR
jgi:uncharacterized caspase-like protein